VTADRSHGFRNLRAGQNDVQIYLSGDRENRQNDYDDYGFHDCLLRTIEAKSVRNFGRDGALKGSQRTARRSPAGHGIECGAAHKTELLPSPSGSAWMLAWSGDHQS
jgi:hypothetical protein